MLQRVLNNRKKGDNGRTRVSRAQRDFHQLKPLTFSGESASMMVDRWLSAIEEAFQSTTINDDDLRLMMAPNLFRDEAIQWWETEIRLHRLDTGTWEQFRNRFLGRYFPQHKRHELRRKFEKLEQVIRMLKNTGKTSLIYLSLLPILYRRRNLLV